MNDAPVAVNDSATTNEDTAVTIAVLNNDSDVDGDPLTSAKVTDPAHGTVTHNANGTFTYTPAANENGGDSFTYKACDNGSPSLCSTVVTVSITINAVNDEPSNVAVNNDVLAENSVYDLSGSFVDPDSGDTHTVTISWGDGSGDKVISLAVGVFDFSASHQYLDDPSGMPDNYTVSVSVSDGAASDSGSATVTVNNVAPIVVMSPSPISLAAGDGFSRPGSFFDPGTLDTWSATVDYGDGLGPQPLTLNADRTFSLSSPEYTAAAVYTVSVSVRDKDGGVGTQSFQVSVAMPAVAIDHIDDPAAISKNSPLSATFTFTGSANRGYTSSINWGDASGVNNLQSDTATTDGTGQGAVSGSHTYAHSGTYKVFVTVTDSVTHVSDTKSFTVTVQTP